MCERLCIVRLIHPKKRDEVPSLFLVSCPYEIPFGKGQKTSKTIGMLMFLMLLMCPTVYAEAMLLSYSFFCRFCSLASSAAVEARMIFGCFLPEAE